jgi:hypothetical protein
MCVARRRVKACRIRRHGRTVACHRKRLRRKSALPPGFRGQMIRLHADTTTSTRSAIEGLGDDVRALDTEALGIMFLQSLGQTSTADQVLAYTQNALAVRAGGAPLQTDRTAISPAYGAEFHVWPAAAAGAWLLLAEHKPTTALFPSFS